MQAHGSVQHPQAGEGAHFKEQHKNAGNKIIDGTELSYLPAAVMDLGHHTKAKAWSQRSIIWRDASTAPTRSPTALVKPSFGAVPSWFVGAMRGVAESYYCARRLSYNRLKRCSYNAFDATVPDRTRLRYSGSADQF